MNDCFKEFVEFLYKNVTHLEDILPDEIKGAEKFFSEGYTGGRKYENIEYTKEFVKKLEKHQNQLIEYHKIIN